MSNSTIYCPHNNCFGHLTRVKHLVTGQVVYICNENQVFFAGRKIPDKQTLAFRGRRYDTMLGLDIDVEGSLWRQTDEPAAIEWDVETFFRNSYNPRKSSRATRNHFGDKGIRHCDLCRGSKMIHTNIDAFGRKSEYEEAMDTELNPIFIEKTGQEVLYCKTCGRIFAEYREPEEINSCRLDFYLAMLNIIK